MGVVMSDDLAAAAVRSIQPGTRALRFIQAGGDLIISTSLGDARAMAGRLLARARAHPAFADRIDASVLRILRAKDVAGLLPCS
jgi:beta-N-acetylhexosaminidase